MDVALAEATVDNIFVEPAVGELGYGSVVEDGGEILAVSFLDLVIRVGW